MVIRHSSFSIFAWSQCNRLPQVFWWLNVYFQVITEVMVNHVSPSNLTWLGLLLSVGLQLCPQAIKSCKCIWMLQSTVYSVSVWEENQVDYSIWQCFSILIEFIFIPLFSFSIKLGAYNDEYPLCGVLRWLCCLMAQLGWGLQKLQSSVQWKKKSGNWIGSSYNFRRWR